MTTIDVDGHGPLGRIPDLTPRHIWATSASDTVQFQQVFHYAPSITMLLDRNGRVGSVNPAFTRLLGHEPTVVIGQYLTMFCADGAGPELERCTQRAIDSRNVAICEVAMRSADPLVASRPMRVEIAPLVDDPVVERLVATAHDVTDLHTARQNLEHLTRHDHLTGLVNRSALIEQLEQIIDGHGRAAVVFVDLDRFKPVNDLLGHQAGDELLCIAADRLRQVVRPGDLVARVGGDEFVIIAEGIGDRQTARLLAGRIETTLTAPYMMAAGTAKVTASIGIAVAEDGCTSTSLLADADQVMQEVKAARRGETPRDPHECGLNSVERRRTADELAAGLTRGEVIAFLQPVVSTSTGRTIGFEALARWRHPEKGLLAPGAFLGLAANAGLDLLVGDMVLKSACSAIAELDGAPNLGLNLSVDQLGDEQLCGRLGTILAEHGMSFDRLSVEITEHDSLTRRAGGGRVAPDHNLNRLSELGALLCLDDFGTGFSSLTHIRRYPVSAIKIDQSFVRGVADTLADRAIVAAVVDLASILGLKVVAEGVETPEQLTTVADMGCDMAQGHLISGALAPEDVSHWMRHRGPDWRRDGEPVGSSRCQVG